MILRVVDVETTGVGPEAQVCEIATVDLVRQPDDTWVRGRLWSSLVCPGVPMPPDASAIHHLTDDDVAEAPALGDLMPAVLGPGDGTEKVPYAFVAHHADFERQFIKVPGARWICTYRVGVTLWPECPRHTNQTLRYFLGLHLDPRLAMPPHRAAPDAYTTAAILRAGLRAFEVTPDELVGISDRPVALPRLHFGKHAGEPIADVPSGYLRWMLDQVDMDPDAKHTAKMNLHWRNEAARSRSPVSADKVLAEQKRAGQPADPTTTTKESR